MRQGGGASRIARGKTTDVRDLVFLLAVLGFFGIAVLFVHACALVLGQQATREEERTP